MARDLLGDATKRAFRHAWANRPARAATRAALSRMLLLLSLLIATRPAAAEPPEPKVEMDGDPRAGHVTLTWGPREGADEGVEVYQLEEATREDFADAKTQYRGRHTSSVISGLPNGTFYYRVRYRRKADGTWSDWSDTRAFTVEHYSRGTAGAFFALGAVVFAVTAGFILRAQREV